MMNCPRCGKDLKGKFVVDPVFCDECAKEIRDIEKNSHLDDDDDDND